MKTEDDNPREFILSFETIYLTVQSNLLSTLDKFLFARKAAQV